MNSHRRSIAESAAGPLLILVLCGLIGCANVPQITRTGIVHEIVIGRAVSPADLAVAVGDEVRWMNYGQSSVRVELDKDVRDALSCERGFSMLWRTMESATTLASARSASLCFIRTGLVSFRVRRVQALPGEDDLVNGTIVVARQVTQR